MEEGKEASMMSWLVDLAYYARWEWEISQARKKAELEEWEDFLESHSVLRKPFARNQTNQCQPDQNSSSPE